MPSIRVALGQINSVVGDIEGNSQKILSALQSADAASADLVIFPELSLTGYPPEDLVFRSDFVKANQDALAKIAPYISESVVVVGYVDANQQGIFNAAGILHDGRQRGTYHKRKLPNYSVFDEQRTFHVGTSENQLYEIAGVRVGIVICEDAWFSDGPINELADGGAELVIVINASPFYAGRVQERVDAMATRARETNCAIAYINLVGGQDELVFDGGSFVLAPNGQLLASAPQFEETNFICDLQVGDGARLHSISFPLI